MGQVCPKHQEFYEKECRWCEPRQWEEIELPQIPFPPIKQYMSVEIVYPTGWPGLPPVPQE